MRRTLPLALTAAVAVAACQDTSSPASPDLAPPAAESPATSTRTVDVIVPLDRDFAPGGHEANQRAAEAVARSLGLSPSHAYGTALYGFAATIPEGRLNGLRNDPRVAAVEVDQIATVIPGPGFGPAAPPPGKGPGGGGEEPPSGQSTPWGINRVGGAVTYTGTNVAWIIDSGIDLDHPDLNVAAQGHVDFTNSRKGADDENGHGTHVAGTVAAIDNTIDVVGVAAGATVVAVKVLDRRGSGSYSGVIAGIDHVAANGENGDVANMSLGGGFSQALNDAVVAASSQVKFAIAAGNSGANANNYSPASANGNNIYTIAAFAYGDTWASFSNYGDPPVDYAAPGVNVESLKAGGGTVSYNGTSMAAPHVAGILLLGNVSTSGTVSRSGTSYPIARH